MRVLDGLPLRYGIMRSCASFHSTDRQPSVPRASPGDAMTIRKANANPTKAFFVRMLTRDISLDDCILDLVDNSVDGAWRTSGQTPSTLTVDTSLHAYRVDLCLSERSFSISDNCGGISLDDAADYAFTFGRREEQERGEYTVGVYGIGMKRAVFKLGKDIRINSTYAPNGRLESFVVPISVDDWLSVADGPWDFDIDERDPDDEAGVCITVKDLLPETATKFSDPTYERSLRRILGRDYMIPLMRGLTLTVNAQPVTGWKLELRENENFAPMRHSYVDGDVAVEIVAGMAFPPPDDREPDETKKANDVSGWYILCNGRVVLAADTSTLTGWGVSLPKWHKQYTGFAGVVLFSAENPELLPMTTTKRNVDVSSAVYQRAIARMHEPARAWIDYTNGRKQDIEAAKPLEETAAATDIFAVTRSATFKVPTIARPSAHERVANVNYAVPLKRLKALASALGDSSMSYRDVGLTSFDYAYDDHVDEDDET